VTDWNVVNAFIGSVIAWPGAQDPGFANLQYSYHDTRQPDGKLKGKYPVSPGKPFRDPAQLVSFAGWLNGTTNNKDVWFCTSIQGKTKLNRRGNVIAARSAMDALMQKSIWIDADVDATDPKKYGSVEEALKAILTFQTVGGLPRPSAIVFSGSGVHVYWISKRGLTPLEWQPFASGLRNMLLANNVKCDAGLTTDIARILRMPGTFNHKYDPPKPVELSPLPLKLYDFDTDLALLKTFAGPVIMPGPQGPAHSLFAEGVDPAIFRAGPVVKIDEPDLNAGIDKFVDNLVAYEPIFKNCGFYKHALRTGGADYNQPLWNLSVLGTTFMENGNAVAHAISKGHAEYSEVDTQALYDRKMAERHDRGIGYPSCSTIEGSGCTACATCPLKSKGKSPLNIRPVVTATVNPKMGQSPAAAQVGLPSGFDLNEDGIICKVVEKTSKEGEDFPPELVPLFQTKLYDFWAQKHPDCLNYTVDVDKGFIHFACVPHEEISKTGFRAYLANERCRTLINTAGMRFLEEFYLSILGKLRAAMASQMAVPFGWYEEDGKRRGFSFGGKIAMDDGTVRPCGIGDPNIKRYYTPTGTLQVWHDACDTVTRRKRPELNAIMLMSFASPLAALVGKDSIMFSAWGDSAAGKSAAYKVGMSVWGHSKLTKGSETSTHNNVTTQMAEIKNLPFYWDEIEDDKHRETVAKVMHEASDGVQKGRNKDGKSTQARGEWKLMIMAASNQSFKEFLFNRNKNHTASLVRCLEWKVLLNTTGVGQMKDAEATALLNACESNYGRMGEIYAEFLAQNHAVITQEVIEEANKVEAFYGCNGEERYWQSGVASMICAARYAKQLGVDVDPDEIKRFMYDVYAQNREEMVKRGMRAKITDKIETVLTLYLKARYANERVIWTNYMHNTIGRPPKPVVILKGPHQARNQQGGIEARFAIENRLLVIASEDFDTWLREKKYQSTALYDALEKEYGALIGKQLRLASGTVHDAGREPCILIPNIDPASSLGEFMMMYATDIERAAMQPGATGTNAPTGFEGVDNAVPLRRDANGLETPESVAEFVKGAAGA